MDWMLLLTSLGYVVAALAAIGAVVFVIRTFGKFLYRHQLWPIFVLILILTYATLITYGVRGGFNKRPAEDPQQQQQQQQQQAR